MYCSLQHDEQRHSVITQGHSHKVTKQELTSETLCGHDKHINMWG